MPDETLTVSDPMTIEQIDAAYPDHCIYIVDPTVDPETNQLTGGRVAFASREREPMSAFISKTRGTWRSTATRYTRKPDDDLDIITRFLF
ncbi:MAG: hypothetical protein AAF743_16045 [Planctomycetota bacterium]